MVLKQDAPSPYLPIVRPRRNPRQMQLDPIDDKKVASEASEQVSDGFLAEIPGSPIPDASSPSATRRSTSPGSHERAPPSTARMTTRVPLRTLVACVGSLHTDRLS